jgi:3-oxoadipyl-CoA thiolase
MNACFVVDAVRTPIGKLKGALRGIRPDDLMAHAIRALVSRNQLVPDRVDEVYVGCANQAGEDSRNVARMASLLAGLPFGVPAATVNRLCGSGLEAIIMAARMIQLGEADLVIAGGVESMTRAPWSVPKPTDGFPSGKLEGFDTALGWRYPNARLAELFPLESMGETAENVAVSRNIGREEQDRFAMSSHSKAIAAQSDGRFASEIIAVDVAQPKGALSSFSVDEQPRADTSLEKLSALKPAFRTEGTVTAGNASALNDGAAALLLMSERAIAHRAPLARYVSSATAGVAPQTMGLGPVPATRRALAKAQWRTDTLDLIELNEAFAAQALACMAELELEPSIVNVNGGAIALGHPLGMSGARIVTTLLHAMRDRRARRGLATMCIGVGQGIAATFERT